MGDDDWDPFAVEEEETSGAPAVSEPVDVDEEEEKLKIPAGDIEGIVGSAVYKAGEEKAWMKMDTAGLPDLTLHTPSCGADNWTHTAVELKIGKGIAYIILNKPGTDNALDDDINLGMKDAIYALHSRHDIRLVVLTGKGKMFCAGGECVSKDESSAKGAKPFSPEVQEARKELLARAMKTGFFKDESELVAVPHMKDMWNFSVLPQLTVCILNGSVMGGGVGWMCAADVVISIQSAQLTMSDVKLGVVPAMIAPYVIGKVGPGKAKILMCQAETQDAEMMKQLGFVQHIVADMSEANNVLQTICKQVTEESPLTVKQCKQLINGLAARPIVKEVIWFTMKRMKEILKDADVNRPWTNDKIEAMSPVPW